MKIFFWGEVVTGYRQEGFRDYVIKNKYILLYSKTYLKSTNKYIKFISTILNDVLNFCCMCRTSIVYIPPMEHTILKIILGRLCNKKIICDIYAPLFDMTVNDEKIYNQKSIMGRLYYYRDRFAMLKSTVVLFLNEAEKNYFCQTVNLFPNEVKSRVVPLIIEKKPFAKKSFFSDKSKKLNICWTGSFVALQGLDVIIEAIKILKTTNTNFIFNIIGPDNDKLRRYEKIVSDENLSSCVKFVYIWGNMKKWEEYICEECDISLGIFGDSEKAKCVVANKVIDGIAFKTPVITGFSKGIKYYFNQLNDIFTVDNNPKDIADKILEVSAKGLKEIDEYVNNSYAIYNENFSKSAYENNMNKIFKELN